IRPQLQLGPPWIARRHPGQGTLDADELAARFAVLVEPVGVDESWAVLNGMLDDEAQQCVGFVHACPRLGRTNGDSIQTIARNCRLPAGETSAGYVHSAFSGCSMSAIP